MKFFVTFIFSLLVSAYALAALPASFDAAKWNQLVNTIVMNGDLLSSQAGDYMVITQMTPADVTQPHNANYISTLGTYDKDDNYVVIRIESVWEDWQKDSAGNWNITQWIYIISPDGNLISTQGYSIVKGPEGIIQSYQPIKSTDDLNMQKWDQELSGWITSLLK